MIEFPVSGVETYWWLPALVAYIISTFTSTAGLTGAFLLMPFQLSILGFVGPAVSPTNLMFNVLATPSGVVRQAQEKRMVWPLAWVIVIGTIPGMFLGAIVRVKYLPDPASFKIFVGLVLLYLGAKLILDIAGKKKKTGPVTTNNKITDVKSEPFSFRKISYHFSGNSYTMPSLSVMIISFFVGIIGGTYGVGGAAILVPYLVTFYRIPVHTLAGAALFSTLVTSITGVMSYAVAPLIVGKSAELMQPDWLLGLSLGIGGFLGIYTGSRLQKYIPSIIIKIIMAASVLFIAFRYLFKI